MIRRLALLCCIAATPVSATEAEDFVTANIISTLYHEFGHALIDITSAAVQGQEEAAADILSVVLLDHFWEEDAAQSITALTALSFELAAQEAEDPAYWNVHGLDMQRYYNQVCLFYGADPEARAALAADFEIAEDRAATCVDDFTLAMTSWGAALRPLETQKPSKTNQFNGETASDIAILLNDELRDLNASYSLPRPVAVSLASCGEENAFYDPATTTITICKEYVDFLERQAIANDL